MRIALVAVGLASLLGCVQNTTLTVDIVVPVDVMAAATAYPGRVGFGTSMHTGTTWAVCGAEDQDLTITLDDVASGCAQEPLEVAVYFGPFVPPSTGCVEENAGPFSALEGGEHWASAVGTAFADANSATCITDDDHVEIVLELPAN